MVDAIRAEAHDEMCALASRNVPFLLAVVRAAVAVSDVACDEEPQQAACGRCDWCRLRTALEPLLREVER
jgi:hypothetical protein